MSPTIRRSSSWADVNSPRLPVTRFSRRPIRASGVASLRSLTTYARRLGYLESELRTIAGISTSAVAARVGATDCRVVRERSLFGRKSPAASVERAREGAPAHELQRLGILLGEIDERLHYFFV